MAGAVLALLASAESVSQFDVAVGTDPGVSFGFAGVGIPYGALTPATFRGSQILFAANTTTLEFRLWIAGIHPRTFIRRVVVQDSTGTNRNLLQTEASFSSGPGTGGDSSRWEWSGSPTWTTTHASRNLLIFFYHGN